MTSALKWRLGVGLVVVFLAGTASGLFGGAWYARHVFINGHGPRFHERMREHIISELHLTPEQANQVGPILDRASRQLDSIREETGKRVAETMSQSHDEMLPLLNPEQRVKLEKMRERHRAFLQMHGPGPRPPPPEN